MLKTNQKTFYISALIFRTEKGEQMKKSRFFILIAVFMAVFFALPIMASDENSTPAIETVNAVVNGNSCVSAGEIKPNCHSTNTPKPTKTPKSTMTSVPTKTLVHHTATLEPTNTPVPPTETTGPTNTSIPPTATETEITPSATTPAPTTPAPSETPTEPPTPTVTVAPPTSVNEPGGKSRAEWLTWKATVCELDCGESRTETYVSEKVNLYFGNVEGCLLDGCKPFVDIVTTGSQPLRYYGEPFADILGVKYERVVNENGEYTRYHFDPLLYLNWGLTLDGEPILGMEQNRNILCSLYPQPWNFNSDGDLVVSEGMNSSTVAQWMVETGIYNDYMTAYRYVGQYWIVGKVGFTIPMPK